MPVLTALAKATGTYTSTGVFTNAQTLVIGGKTYTTQTSLTDSDGNVLIGGSAEATIDNLVAAINLAAGAGTVYAASMTRNPYVSAVKGSATTLVVTALLGGIEGNLITTTETQTNGSWGGATLSGGSGSASLAIDEIIRYGQLNADVITALYELK